MEKKWKTIVLCVVGLINGIQASVPATNGAEYYLTAGNAAFANSRVGGSIVVIDDDDLRVICSESYAHITSIQVYVGSTLVQSFSGCGSDVCEYQTNLVKGGYTVKVYTDVGNWSQYVSVD